MMDVIDKVIRANDKPRAEVVIDVQILEVNRNRTKEFGINLSNYALGLTFSPEVAPPNSGNPPTPPTAPPPFNLNTISQGVSTADFYLTVPTAAVRFLENDTKTKQIAKPQLRGAEGQEMTLNLGEEIPVISTVFGAAVSGGFASIPQSSFNYRPVGVNIAMTPRVTYEGEVILDLTVESSTLGASISVAGQDVPSFGSRKVKTRLRLREGESNLLAGLLRDDQRKSLTGFPGAIHVPVLRSLFGSTSDTINQTDIVMLLTPHIVRTHDLTAEDLAPIYIGTQQNVGLSGPPPLIAPVPNEEPAPAAAPPSGAPTSTIPGTPPPGPARPPAAAPLGVPQANTTPPPGTSPVPNFPPPPPPPVVNPAAPVPAGPPAATPPPATAAPSTGDQVVPSPVDPNTPVAPPTGPPRDVTQTAPNAPARFAGRAVHTSDRHGTAGDAGGKWAVDGTALGQQRLAAVGHDADRDVQPERSPRADRSGRDVHAPGRCHGDVHAAHRCGRGPRGHRNHPQRRPGRRIGDGPARGAACSTRSGRATRRSTSAVSPARPKGRRSRSSSRRWWSRCGRAGSGSRVLGF